MGPAKTQVLIAAALAALGPGRAVADPCTGVTRSGARFATCFDVGNRLSVTAASDGFGGSIAIRHVIHFDDEPDLVWKLEHHALEATYAGFEDRFTGTLYRGRFLRHARDGHIVLPFGIPRKIFLPFDIGALAEVGTVSWRPTSDLHVGVVEVAALLDFARTRGFRRRLAFGPVARWDVDVARAGRAVSDHAVAPFSAAIADLRVESSNGLTVGDLRIEAGTAWHSTSGWQPDARAEASLERIVLAVNERPIALMLGVRYASETDEAIAQVGARVVLFQHRDPRVLRGEH